MSSTGQTLLTELHITELHIRVRRKVPGPKGSAPKQNPTRARTTARMTAQRTSRRQRDAREQRQHEAWQQRELRQRQHAISTRREHEEKSAQHRAGERDGRQHGVRTTRDAQRDASSARVGRHSAGHTGRRRRWRSAPSRKCRGRQRQRKSARNKSAQPVNGEPRTVPSGARRYESGRVKRVARRRQDGDARGGEGRATREYDVWRGPGAQRRRWRD